MSERQNSRGLPLEGFRVLDITSGIAGPYASRLLARYGCDVLKVERPGEGDSARRFGPFPGGIADSERSGMFAYLNQDKRGITLDVTHEAAQPVLDALIMRSDLVLTSLRPPTLDRALLTRERIGELNPTASFVAISNFGQDGPYRDLQATETILYGLGGPMHVTGHLHRHPVRLGRHVVEFNGGATAAFAASLALFSLATTGVGRYFDLSLLETQVASHDRQASFLMVAQFTGETFKRLDPEVVADRVWPCADGYVDVGYNAAPFERILTCIGRPDLIDDPLFVNADARQTMESQAVFTGLLLEWMMQRTMLEAWQTLQQYEIPSGPVYTSKQILEDPHFAERGMWEHLKVGDRNVQTPRLMPWPGEHGARMRPAPRLGEHNDEVFANEIGLDANTIARLRTEGAI